MLHFHFLKVTFDNIQQTPTVHIRHSTHNNLQAYILQSVPSPSLARGSSAPFHFNDYHKYIKLISSLTRPISFISVRSQTNTNKSWMCASEKNCKSIKYKLGTVQGEKHFLTFSILIFFFMDIIIVMEALLARETCLAGLLLLLHFFLFVWLA